MEPKIILVTGASRGIGREIAKQLAECGNIVIANYNKSEQEAIKLQNELKKKNIFIDIFQADVSKRNEVKLMIDFIINKYKKIDVLINNAGIDQMKLFTDITDVDWENMMHTNLYSVFYCTQETVKYMINQQSGLIINISSILGRMGGSCEVHYATTKSAIDGMTKSLARELGLSNIRVNSIAPGIIDTEMNKNLNYNELKNEVPLNRIGKASDIAKCVRWLIDDEYTTGQIIEINGGWNM